MCGTAAAASAVLTVMRTSSEPARGERLHLAARCRRRRRCRYWSSTARRSGAPPPTRTRPIETCTEMRRLMVMRHGSAHSGVSWDRTFDGAMMPPPDNGLSGESPAARPERRRRNFRPETLRHRTADGGDCIPRGFWRAVDAARRPPTEGERRRWRLISQVTGQKGGSGIAMPCRRAIGPGETCGTTEPRCSTCTRSSAPASSTSAAGTCRCSTARRSTSTTPCAAPPACSTSRTCASSTCSGARVREFLQRLLANDVGQAHDSRQGALQLHAQRAGRRHR